MRTLLSAKNIMYEIPGKELFKDFTVSVKDEDRIGLVGRNGTGKSTLLKLFSGILKPSSGSVDIHAVHFYLPQIDLSLFQDASSVENYISKFGESWPLVRANLHKWFKTELAEGRILNTLSGGELMKLQLAIAKTKNPRLLLLDEPTNHLDVEGLEVLRKFLHSFSGAYIIVSHDPFFLDMVTNHTWELAEGMVREYGGKYSFYKEQKELARLAQERDYEVAKKDKKYIIEKQMGNYKKERYPEHNGLTENTVILRRHNSPDVVSLGEDWWKEVDNFSKRDQLSFNYVAWKNNFNYTTMNGFLWDAKRLKYNNRLFKVECHKNDRRY